MELLEKSERRGKERRSKITNIMKDDIVLMYRKGFKIAVIQEKHGISQTSVYRILREREKNEYEHQNTHRPKFVG